MKRCVADECIRLAERVVPGLRGWVAECYASTPLTYRDYIGAPEDGLRFTQGLQESVGGLAVRPHTSAEPVPHRTKPDVARGVRCDDDRAVHLCGSFGT